MNWFLIREAAKIIAKALDSTEYVNEAPKYVREAIRASYDVKELLDLLLQQLFLVSFHLYS